LQNVPKGLCLNDMSVTLYVGFFLCILTRVCVSSAELNVCFDYNISFFLSNHTHVVHKLNKHSLYTRAS